MNNDLEELMQVIIGVDPHKASHTAVAISDRETELANKKVRATRHQVPQLLAWAEPFAARTWAVESAHGMGFLLAQQLVAAGETVLDVPATLVARSRVLASGRSNKNDPNDALSVAVTAARQPGLQRVVAVDHREVLRLLAKRNIDIGKQRARSVCRVHALLIELGPGGLTKEIKAGDVEPFLAALSVASPAEQMRHDLVLELLGDIRRLDTQLKESHKRIAAAVTVSGTSLVDIYGVGPVIAAMVIGYTGDVTRFANREHYAAYTGTAPIEFSSGGRVAHRLSRRGNRHLNHALHLAAMCQISHRGSEGRAYFERKVAEGKTKREAMRSLKRHLSNIVYRQLLVDARRASK